MFFCASGCSRHVPRAPPFQQALFGINPGVTILVEFDHIDKRPTKPATPGDRRASEALPIFEGSEVCTARRLEYDALLPLLCFSANQSEMGESTTGGKLSSAT